MLNSPLNPTFRRQNSSLFLYTMRGHPPAKAVTSFEKMSIIIRQKNLMSYLCDPFITTHKVLCTQNQLLSNKLKPRAFIITSRHNEPNR